MTTIYTKPQIDAMAVKIGGEIKAAKTPVAWGNITGNIADQLDLTQRYYTKIEVNEQLGYFGLILEDLYAKGAYYSTTTTAYPNVNIAADGALSRSTATFGTAAGKDVGTAAGNVMEVGAFGIGGNYQIQSGVLLKDQHINGFGSARITTEVVPADAPNAQIGKVLYIGDPNWGSQVWFSYNNSKVYFRNREMGAEYESWKEFYHSGTPNLAANSIQIGVGAPKIAYKKLTGAFDSTLGTVSLAHGLDATKILDVSVVAKSSLGTDYHKNGSSLADVNFDFYFDVYYLHILPSSGATKLVGQKINALITYEV